MISIPNQLYIGTCDVWEFPSDSRDNLVHIVYKGNFGVKCTCEGWRYTGNCKHVQRLKIGDQVEPDRKEA